MFRTYHEQKTLALLTATVGGVVGIHFVHVIKRKPRLHDGTVTTNPDKNRLVEIPPGSSEPPNDGLTNIQ